MTSGISLFQVGYITMQLL